MSRLAVVVPTYNRGESLRRLLTALRDQEPVQGGHDVIVVDDGSTDSTADIVGEFPFVTYLPQRNAGPAAARNVGWRTASAQIIAFTDDDTVPARNWLQELVVPFDEQGSVLAAVGGAIVPLVPGFLADFVQLEGLVAHGIDANGAIAYLVTANAAYRRDVLKELGGFDESFRHASGEDSQLTLRALRAGHRVALAPRAIVAHDNRTSVTGLLKTYFRHGRSRRQVLTTAGVERRTPQVFTRRHWAQRVRRYRDANSNWPKVFGYLAVRVVGLLAYTVGVLASYSGPAGFRWQRLG